MRRLALTASIIGAMLSASCAWDFRYEAKFDHPKYPQKTPFDRFKERRMASPDRQVVAGAAKVDITPLKKTGVYMGGYGSNRRSTGIHDPLWARCALVDDGKETVVFVGTDLIGLFYDDIAEARMMVSERWGDSVLIGAIHNHEGPDTLGLWGKSPFGTIPLQTGIDPYYQNRVKQGIAKCVFEAAASARPAQFRMAAADVPEGISENLRKEGYKENTMTLFEAVGQDGVSIFTLANWPMHVEALDEGNSLISADWAGVMYREFERNRDGVMVYFQGALGGMVIPRQSKHAPQAEKRRFMEVCGRVAADTARKGLDEKAEKVEVKEIVRRSAKIKIPLENKDLVLAKKMKLITRKTEGKSVDSVIDYLEIGPARFVTVPGEALPAVGFAIKEMLGAKYAFIMGLTGDELGYILPEDYWKDPLYEYERSVSAGPKTAGLVVETIRSLMSSK